MYTTISFPGLGLELNPSRGFDVGPLTVHWYGAIIALGLILAVAYCCRRSSEFGIDEDELTDGVLWVTPLSIVCARIYYCAFEWSSYASNPISVLYIWNGGIAIYGAVIGAVIGVIIFCKMKKVKIAALLDLVALGFLIGQTMGRWGNFFNREAFGGETMNFLRMGLLNTATGMVEYHHPTFLYESVWNLVGFAALHFLSRRREYDGQIALGYAAWYGLGRAMIEGLRTDSLYIPGTYLRVSQLLAIASFAVAVAVLLWQMTRTHRPEKLFVNQVKAAQEAAAAQAAEEAEEAPIEEVEEAPAEEAPTEE